MLPIYSRSNHIPKSDATLAYSFLPSIPIPLTATAPPLVVYARSDLDFQPSPAHAPIFQDPRSSPWTLSRPTRTFSSSAARSTRAERAQEQPAPRRAAPCRSASPEDPSPEFPCSSSSLLFFSLTSLPSLRSLFSRSAGNRSHGVAAASADTLCHQRRQDRRTSLHRIRSGAPHSHAEGSSPFPVLCLVRWSEPETCPLFVWTPREPPYSSASDAPHLRPALARAQAACSALICFCVRARRRALALRLLASIKSSARLLPHGLPRPSNQVPHAQRPPPAARVGRSASRAAFPTKPARRPI